MAKKKVKPTVAEEKEPSYQLKGEIPFLITISKKRWDIKIQDDLTIQFTCFGQVHACIVQVVKNQSQIFKEQQLLPSVKRTLTRTKVNDMIKFQNFLSEMLGEMALYVYDKAVTEQPDKKIEVVSNMKIVDKNGK